MMSLPVWHYVLSGEGNGGSASTEGRYLFLLAVTEADGTHPAGMHSCLV